MQEKQIVTKQSHFVAAIKRNSGFCSACSHKYKFTAYSRTQIRLPAPLMGILMKHCLFALFTPPVTSRRETKAG